MDKLSSLSSNKKIAKNTILLYIRMLFIMAVSLYTSRVNLNVLGIENNGIYQVVGGIVTILAFLNGSLAGATSRFLSFEIGRGDSIKLRLTFSASLTIHIILAVIILIIAETGGLWFLNNKLIIPENRLFAANIVYQCSIVSCLISIIQIPYTAIIIAREKMGAFAYLGIVDVMLKLAICYLLYLIPFDKLIIYGILVTVVSLLNISLYQFYVHKNFKECRFTWIKDMEIVKPILSFSGWNLFGNLGVAARTQGINILLNMFLGPAINAAAGFAGSIGNAVFAFSNNFLTAIRPPIVKAYSQQEFIKMQDLMINASKYSFCLLLIFSTPFFFESQYIVTLWLKTPPLYTAQLCVIELALHLLSSLFIPLVFVIHATGKIKFMSIVNGSIWFSTIPLSFIGLKLGLGPTIPYLIKIFLLIFIVISNIYNVRKLIPSFDIVQYLKKAVVPASILGVITLIPTYFVSINLKSHEFLNLFITTLTSSIIILTTVWLFFLEKGQKKFIATKISTLIRK